MERAFFVGIVVLIVLTVFTQGSPIKEENDGNVMRKDSLLDKLGMELHRDPFYSPYKKRGYWGWRRRYRKRKGKKGSETATTGTDSDTDPDTEPDTDSDTNSDTASGTDSGSDSESDSGTPGKYWGYSKYGK